MATTLVAAPVQAHANTTGTAALTTIVRQRPTLTTSRQYINNSEVKSSLFLSLIVCVYACVNVCLKITAIKQQWTPQQV